VHHQLDPAPQLLADRRVREPHPGHHRERLEPAERVRGRVRVHGGQRSVVARVESGQEVQGFAPPHFTDHDAVRPHAERVAKQVANRHLSPSLDARRPALQPHHVVLAQAKLCRILESDHPLGMADVGREGIEEGRLSGSRPSRDHDAPPGANRGGQ
jgi:hypothetical protein